MPSYSTKVSRSHGETTEGSWTGPTNPGSWAKATIRSRFLWQQRPQAELRSSGAARAARSLPCPVTALPAGSTAPHAVPLSSRHHCGKHPSHAHGGLFWAHHLQHRQWQREECLPYPAQLRYSTEAAWGSSSGGPLCSATGLRAPPEPQEHHPHLYASKVNSVSIGRGH